MFLIRIFKMVIKLIISDLAGVLTENGDILLFEQLQELFPNKPLKKMEEVAPGLKLLIERGYIKAIEDVKAGTFEVNPIIKTL